MRLLLTGSLLAGAFVALAVVSFLWTPGDVMALDIAQKLQPPSATHWFGTDHFSPGAF